MLYHDDPDWYERPGQTVDIPLGPSVTASRHTNPGIPGQCGRYDAVTPDYTLLTPRQLPVDQSSMPSSQDTTPDLDA
jgi:hypothetical protein